MKNLFKITFLLFSISLFSQDFLGKVEYQTMKNTNNSFTNKKKSENTEKEDAKDDLSKEDKIAVKEAITKAFQKKYLLTFNKNEALFEQVQELDKPKPSDDNGFSFSIKISGDGNKYINTKDKISIEEEDLMDEEFLVKDSLQKIDWTLSDETKKIGDYMCLKATYIIQISKIHQQSYDKYLEKIEKGEKPLFEIKKPEPTTVIAWYTPEIPVSFGPAGIWGLPGLILQLEESKLIYLCTKVSLKNNEKVKIKIPNQGKIVTKKEFEKFQEKIQKRMDDNGGAIFTTTKE
jgi:GLPGLI family protein